MKSMGIAFVLAALVVGGGIICNLLSRMAEETCAKECPDLRATALTTTFEAGPFHLLICDCAAARKAAK